jgi:5-amino-6-(5-phosphoribosylamino)uracil reductase
VVVSRSGRFDPSLPFFSQPLERWLLQSQEAAEIPDASAAASGQRFHRTLPLLDWRASLAALKQRGLERLVVLGGAQLAAALLEEQLVEELQLTLCPLLLGGPHTWLGPMVSITPGGWKLVERRDLEGSELLLRYQRH